MSAPEWLPTPGTPIEENHPQPCHKAHPGIRHGEWERHRRGPPFVVRPHRPLPVRVSSRCRVDCSCGWRGPVVPTFGAGQTAWVEHFRETKVHVSAT